MKLGGAKQTGAVPNEMLSGAGDILSNKRRPWKPMRAVHLTVLLLQLNSHLPNVLEERSGEDPITQPRRRSPV